MWFIVEKSAAITNTFFNATLIQPKLKQKKAIRSLIRNFTARIMFTARIIRTIAMRCTFSNHFPLGSNSAEVKQPFMQK